MIIMKNIKILCIAIALISTSAFGQTAKQKRADRQFNSFSFVKAIDTYEKLIDTSFNKHYAMRKLADAYIMLRQPERALPMYKRIVQQENVPSEYFLYYAQTLRANGKYEESKEWMKKYRDAGNTQDSRVKRFFKNDDLASAIFNTKEKNTINKLGFNTEFNEFGAVALNDAIVFSSSRDEGVSVKRLYAWDKQPLLDMYQVSSEKGSVESTTELEGDVNTIHHDGPATFNAAGTKMYFSRNNYHDAKKIADAKGIMHVGIYSADLVDGQWTNVQATNLNNANYIVYHPSLSADGKSLYFASDMPGGYGGRDIWMVKRANAETVWSSPENLGSEINTAGDELFPYIHANGNIYFSSNGRRGMGGLDIFKAVPTDIYQWGQIEKMKYPINSGFNDYGLIFEDDHERGYMTSNRPGSKGQSDIWCFRLPPLAYVLQGNVYDKETSDINLWASLNSTQRYETWMKLGKIIDKTASIGLQFSALYHNQESSFGMRNYDATQKSFYGNSIYQKSIGDEHVIKTGLSLLYDVYDEQVSANSYQREEIVYGAFGEYTFKFEDKFTAIAGMRIDNPNNYGIFVTPRLNLRYALAEKSVLRASLGRGQKTANIFSENIGAFASSMAFVITGDGSDKPYGLDAEVAWNYGMSFSQEIMLNHRPFILNVDYFYTDFTNQIVID